jgi:hypothetical protein
MEIWRRIVRVWKKTVVALLEGRLLSRHSIKRLRKKHEKFFRINEKPIDVRMVESIEENGYGTSDSRLNSRALAYGVLE